MPLHSRDVLKLLKVGFIIIRADNINLRIKCKSYYNRTPEWTTLERDFTSKAAVRRKMDELLKNKTIIED